MILLELFGEQYVDPVFCEMTVCPSSCRMLDRFFRITFNFSCRGRV